MSTQQTNKLVTSMVAGGVPATHAVAIATSIEHALACDSYAAQYGTFMVDALREFVAKATTDVVEE